VSRVTRRKSEVSRGASVIERSQCKPKQKVNDEDQDENDMHKNIYTITSISTIQDQHVSDRQECDGEVIGCLNMLTRTYTTGRRQRYSRRSRTSSHEHIHYKALEIEHSTQHTRRNVAKKVRQSRIWIIKVLKPTKLMCQMCLQSHTQTHLNQTTKTPIPHISACGLMPPSQVMSLVSNLQSA
jgi:hypothetical protein